MGHLVENEHERLFRAELKTLISSLTTVKEEVSSLLTKAKELSNKLLPFGDLLILDVIMDVTIKYYNVTEGDLKGESREGAVMKARRVFMALSYDLTDKRVSYSKIGKIVDKDHATVINACKTTRNFNDTNDVLYHEYLEIKSQVEDKLKQIKEERNEARTSNQIG